jgi:hypothetical protein
MDPDADPGGPKAYGSYGSGPGCGSGSATLLSSVRMFNDGIYDNILLTYLLKTRHLLYGRYDGNMREAMVGC